MVSSGLEHCDHLAWGERTGLYASLDATVSIGPSHCSGSVSVAGTECWFSLLIKCFLCINLFVLHVLLCLLPFFSFSLCFVSGLAAACDCGTPWTCLLTLLHTMFYKLVEEMVAKRSIAVCGRSHNMSQLMRLWYLSNRRPAKAQASLRIRAVSPEPSLFAHIKYGSRGRVRQKIRHVAPLDGCACAFE